MKYIIAIEPLTNVTLEANDSSICSSVLCKYECLIPREAPELNYSVYVMAKNRHVDGLSPKQKCNTRIHSKKHWYWSQEIIDAYNIVLYNRIMFLNKCMIYVSLNKLTTVNTNL